jgi:uncharacterized repeat protein (TIGR03803 family)
MANQSQGSSRISVTLRRAARTALVLAAALGLSMVSAQPAQAQTLTPLYSFTGGTDGANPSGNLLMRAGNLYSTTNYGGDLSCSVLVHIPGCGVVFGVSSSGKETVLHAFTGNADGADPIVGLVALAGNGYGVTANGGAFGSGTVFKINGRTGKETVVYTFTGGADGGNPNGTLIIDPAGNLYGTAQYGGDLSCHYFGSPGCGVVFKFNPATGVESVLYTFTGPPDGEVPSAGLLRDPAGNLYGTTADGGASANCGAGVGCGTVFELNTSLKETVLLSFDYAHGAHPFGGLIADKAGYVYGDTVSGGPFGLGAVFKLGTTGETVLYNFDGGADGADPTGSLLLDPAGNLYGTTEIGGDLNCAVTGLAGCGVVFKLDTMTGTLTPLWSFTGGADGAQPGGGLIRDAAGAFYGVTFYGGNPACHNGGTGCGVVFKLIQ